MQNTTDSNITTDTLNFDRQYDSIRAMVGDRLETVERLVEQHAEIADGDRNGLGQINYRNVTDLRAVYRNLQAAIDVVVSSFYADEIDVV